MHGWVGWFMFWNNGFILYCDFMIVLVGIIDIYIYTYIYMHVIYIYDVLAEEEAKKLQPVPPASWMRTIA